MWLTGLVAPWHVGSSQTRARTRVPCIGRQILNHCATREALSQHNFLKNLFIFGCVKSPLLHAGPALPLRAGCHALPRRTGPSPRRPLQLWSTGSQLGDCGPRSQQPRLAVSRGQAQRPRGMWDPPGPGPEPASPALAGGLPTTAAPGKLHDF